jgi:hypothetical protein
MKKKYISLGFILLMVLLVFSGCGIAQDKYDAVVSERDTAQAEAESLQSDLDAAQAEAESLQSDLDAAIDGLQSELNTAIDEKDGLLKELITTVNEKDTLQSELDGIKSVCPPGEFNSYSELKDWVSINKQPSTDDLGSLFKAALEVQQLGLQEGYLISVVYVIDDIYPDNGWVYNGALVNGSLFYVWDPRSGIFPYWYSDIS